MAKIKKIYLSGASLLEVIVSTVIILIAFLLFTVLISQLMTARKIVPETQLLFGISAGGWVRDTNAIRKIYRDSKIEMNDKVADTFLFTHLKVKDGEKEHKIFECYFIPDSQKESLYQ